MYRSPGYYLDQLYSKDNVFKMKNKKIDLDFEEQNTITEESDESDEEDNQQKDSLKKASDVNSYVTSSDCKFLYYLGKMAFKAKVMYEEGIKAMNDFIAISMYLNQDLEQYRFIKYIYKAQFYKALMLINNNKIM